MLTDVIMFTHIFLILVFFGGSGLWEALRALLHCPIPVWRNRLNVFVSFCNTLPEHAV